MSQRLSQHMHFHTLVSFVLALFLLTSCANEGVIVRKDAGPLPFYGTLGVDGSYAFLLRDNAGSMHRQLVTPEVFERYAIGQYFNDLQPVATPTFNFKEVRTASVPVARNPSRLAASPVTHRARRTASSRKATHTRHSVAKAHKSRKAIAKRTPTHRRKKAIRIAQAHTAKVKPSGQMLLVKVDRNR